MTKTATRLTPRPKPRLVPKATRPRQLTCIARNLLPHLSRAEWAGPCAVVTAFDPDADAMATLDWLDVKARLDLRFYDVLGETGDLHGASASDVARIATVIRDAQAQGWHFLAVCEMGAGRSAAIVAAVARLAFQDDPEATKGVELQVTRGMMNRTLYRALCVELGLSVLPEPLVSVVVRVKYPMDRLTAFALSMCRQRYTHWECLVVSDGRAVEPAFLGALATFRSIKPPHASVRLIETPERKGRWGHPYRDLGIAAAKGEYLCLQNDDNYLTPSYLEQLVTCALVTCADLVTCPFLLNYFGYTPFETTPAEGDLGAFLVKTALAQATPWPGTDFLADRKYLRALARKAKRIEKVSGVLYVHN